MNTYLIELCPICIDNPATYFTECNHAYCINCLCRINKCAMCRKPLQRKKICIQIKLKATSISNKLEINPVNDILQRDTAPQGVTGTQDLNVRFRTRIDSRGRMYDSVSVRVNLPDLNRLSNQNDGYSPNGTQNLISRIEDNADLYFQETNSVMF